MPHEQHIDKKHRENQVLNGITATVVGAFSGISGVVAQTRTHFHKKLTDSIAHTKTEQLADDMKVVDLKLESATITPEELPRLHSEKAAIENRLELKRLYDARSESLDENFFKRILNSFTGEKTQREATHTYIHEGSEIKDRYTTQLRRFAKDRLGIESEGIAGITTGTLQRFQFMGKETKFNIALSAGIATFVGAAGTMMFFNSLNTHNKLDQLVRNQEEALANGTPPDIQEQRAPKMRHALPNRASEPSTHVKHVTRDRTLVERDAPEMVTER